jgi:hypothetical protein
MTLIKPAISKLMMADGIRVVIPFWRTDVYGNDLVKQQNIVFKSQRQVTDGVGYIPNTGDFC